jgi:endoglucanase
VFDGTDVFLPCFQELIEQGYNIFRVPFAMERMAVGSLYSSLNTEYLDQYSTVIDYITSNGAYAIIDAHNYGRYDDAIITDTTAFQTFWTNLATVFRDNSYAVSISSSMFPSDWVLIA